MNNEKNCDSKNLEFVKYSKFHWHSISLLDVNEAYIVLGTYNRFVYDKEKL